MNQEIENYIRTTGDKPVTPALLNSMYQGGQLVSVRQGYPGLGPKVKSLTFRPGKKKGSQPPKFEIEMYVGDNQLVVDEMNAAAFKIEYSKIRP